MGLSVNTKIKDNIPFQFLEGRIDETTDLGQITVNLGEDLHLDFMGVSHINSTGIKNWLNFFSKVKEDFPVLKITFYNCPKILVDQMNMIRGFLPDGTSVESFAVPYYCEECDKESAYTFERGRDFIIDESTKKYEIKFPEISCGGDSCEMEIDTQENCLPRIS